MRRSAAVAAVVVAVMFVFPTVAPAASSDPYPLPDPSQPTTQVHTGEGLWSTAQRECPGSGFLDYYHALQQLNPWYRGGVDPGTVLWRPSCPVVYSSTVTTTTTTTAPATTTTVAATTTLPATTTTVRPTTTTAPATSTTVAGACPAPANTPGGSDGHGGCFPGTFNTGPNAPQSTMGNYTGSCRITTATVIDSKVIRCELEVFAPLTIRNSYLYGEIIGPDATETGTPKPGPAILVTDTIIDGAEPDGYACGDCGIGGPSWTVLRTEIVHTNRGAYCQYQCLLQDSYIHGTNLRPVASNTAHASGVRVEQYTTLTHNTLACDFQGPFVNDEIGCSADITGYPDFAIMTHNTITGNLLIANGVGNAYCAYGGYDTGQSHIPFGVDPANATYIVFRDNVFQRGPNRLPQYGTGPGVCGAYGPIVAFNPDKVGNVWEGNVWDTGGLVPSEN